MTLKLSKMFLSMLESSITYFTVSQKTKSSVWSDRILMQNSKMYKFGKRILNYFSGKARQIVKLCRNVHCILEFSIKLFLSWSKASVESSKPWNIESRLYNEKFCWPIKNRFSGKARQTLKRSKTFLPYWSFL